MHESHHSIRVHAGIEHHGSRSIHDARVGNLRHAVTAGAEATGRTVKALVATVVLSYFCWVGSPPRRFRGSWADEGE
jgi:hypothetical protein